MYKLLIVDDEPIVCNGLVKFIDWHSLGFEVIHTANSVAQALVFLEQSDVDVVMTDIRMPVQTGLHLLEIINEEYPDIKTLILSGHNDFEYAKQAMRSGAIDFITKPANFDELRSIFTHIKNLLDSEKLQKATISEYISLKKETLLNTLILGYYDSSQATLLSTYNLLEGQNFFVFRLFIDISVDQYKLLTQTKRDIYDYLDIFLSSYGTYNLFNNAPQELCCILYPQNVISSNNFFDPLVQSLLALFHSPISIGIGNIYNSISDIYHAYTEAGKALRYKIIKQSSYIFYSEINNIFYLKDALSETAKTQILNLLGEQNTTGLLSFIRTLFTSLVDSTATNSNTIYSVSIELVLIIDEYIRNFKSNYISSTELHGTIRDLVTLTSFEDILDYLLNFIQKATLHLRELGSSSHGNMINTALLYIQEHYAEDITLNTLSEVLYLHPIYFSKLFKEKTGENFISYLTHVRIEKSKEFLRNPALKIYDISEMVGYESSKHFSKTFKNLVGLSPKEYRDKL